MIVDAVVAFIQPSEGKRSEVEVRGPIGEGSETDGECAEDVRDVDQLAVPTDAAVSGDAADLELEHPRGEGNFSRVLGHYVREKKVLPLMDALAKMT